MADFAVMTVIDRLVDNGIAHVYAMSMEQVAESIENDFWWTTNQTDGHCSDRLSLGSRCPECSSGHLEYDGLFVLNCPECGYVASSGAFT